MSRRKASKVSNLARKKGKAARRGEGGTHSGAPRKRTRRLLEAGGMLSHTITLDRHAAIVSADLEVIQALTTATVHLLDALRRKAS